MLALAVAADDSHVRVHVPTGDPDRPSGEGSLLVPTLGGNPRPFLAASASEVDWTFDVAPGGGEILFDRYRENSDLALIDLPAR